MNGVWRENSDVFQSVQNSLLGANVHHIFARFLQRLEQLVGIESRTGHEHFHFGQINIHIGDFVCA